MINFGLVELVLIAICNTNIAQVATSSSEMTQNGLLLDFCNDDFESKFYSSQLRLTGQPDFLLGGEHCVAAVLKTGEPYTIDKAGLSDAGCNNGKKVLCEVLHS